MKVKSIGLPAALMAASLFGACQNTGRGIQQDTEKNTAAAKEAGREAGAKAEDATRDAKGTAGNAADATKEASGNAIQNTKDAANSMGAKADAAQQTMDVKTALMADKTVDASDIDVDSSANEKTVTLTGHVKTSAEQKRAGEIAKAKVPGYTVINNLTVEAH